MTHREITAAALAQSAIDCGCAPEDFLRFENTFTVSEKREGARAYLPLPLSFDLVSYGNCTVAQTSAGLTDTAREYLEKYPTEHAFETPHIHVLDGLLAPHGLKVCFMAEYFLPESDNIPRFECPYETRLLYPEDFAGLYADTWSNALCEKRKQLDVLAVGAYDNGKLIGLAGCSADCPGMYQIGIDVLPGYRRRGVGAALTSRLAGEIFALGKIPFYCAAWCNIKSVNNAIKCGFRPAWVELTARETAFVDEMNRR